MLEILDHEAQRSDGSGTNDASGNIQRQPGLRGGRLFYSQGSFAIRTPASGPTRTPRNCGAHSTPSIVEEGIPWAVYGTFSAVHIFANTSGIAVDPDSFDPLSLNLATVKSNKGTSLVSKLRLAMRVNGVDLSGWPGGPVSAVHDDRDMDHTVAAFRESIRMLKSEGEIAPEGR